MKSKHYETLWDERSKYFDVDYKEYDMDAEFFSAYFTGKVCELGAGTLRMAKLLVDKYDKFFAVDLSNEMMQQGLSLLDQNIRNKITTVHSGMEQFSLPEKADLIFNLGNSFYMISDEMKAATLNKVKQNVNENGTFILEVYNPLSWRKKPQNTIIHLRTIETSSEVVTLTYTMSIDEKNKHTHITWFREEVDKETREVRKNVFPIVFQFMEMDELRELISEHFKIQQEFGSFERDDFDASSSTRAIFVCKPTQ